MTHLPTPTHLPQHADAHIHPQVPKSISPLLSLRHDYGTYNVSGIVNCLTLRQATAPSPSSSASPPSLLQSSFSSAGDPHNVEPAQTPHTPPRGRSRYPSSLAPDGPRVPLHRRGTSNTYERLEDLLKEAGYKETRIFTPETDRNREHERVRGEGRQSDGKLKNGVDTMFGYLAGLVLGQVDDQPADLAPRTHDRVEQSALVSPPTLKSKVASDSSKSWMGVIDYINHSHSHLFQVQQ